MVFALMGSTVIHNTAQNSFDNFQSYSTDNIIIAQMMSTGGEGELRIVFFMTNS